MSAATSLACFDLDGCLIDSTPAITASIRAAAAEVGVPLDPEDDLVWCVGPPLLRSMEQLVGRVGQDPAMASVLVDAYRVDYRATWLERTRVFDGIAEVLDACHGVGLRLAVVTSKPEPIARPILEGVGLRSCFEALHAPAEDHRAEPKRTTLSRALDDLVPDGGAEGTVMIGDRSHDVVAGLDCGTRTVGVTWGAGTRAELDAAGAHVIVDTPAALTTHLLGQATEA